MLLSRLLRECGYETYLLQSETGWSKLANVRKFLRIVRQIASASGARFSETVQAIVELQESGVNEAEASGYDEKTDAVRLMTLHAAKGLEFPIVILPALGSAPPNTILTQTLLPEMSAEFLARMAEEADIGSVHVSVDDGGAFQYEIS